VGIGTTSPDTALHVYGGAAGSVTPAANTILTLENDGLTTLSLLSPDASERAINFGSPSSNFAGLIQYNNVLVPNGFRFQVNAGTDGLAIDSSGNVGIGDTSPDAFLDISSSTASTLFRVDDSGDGDTSPFVILGSGNVGIGTTSPSGNLVINGTTGQNLFQIATSTNQGILIVDESGNIGVGASSPSEKIHSVITGATPSNILRLDSSITSNADVTQGIHLFKELNGATFGWKIEGNGLLDGSSQLSFIGKGSGSESTHMTITRSLGYVGIGNVFPVNKLTVNGTASALNFVATSTTATSTFAGGLAIETSGFVYDFSSNNVGIGTAAPDGRLDVRQSGTDDIFNLYDGATNVLTVLDGGNVGIGTTTPTAHLAIHTTDLSGTAALFLVATTSGATTTEAFSIGADGQVGIGTANPGTKLEVVGDITSKGTSWTSRTSAEDNNWYDVTYGNGLFVAIAISGTGDRVMTSPDGVNWATTTSAADITWTSVTYGNGLFVAVSQDGGGNQVMTSPDGITWTLRTTPVTRSWQGVTYGNGLFVAVAQDGTGNRVMTSPDGINWTSRNAAADNDWRSITYGNSLFVATAFSSTGNRVMTSPDGITWTLRTSAEDNFWGHVTYGNGLFVAVSDAGTNRVMTSPDGITWTSRTAAANNGWQAVTYGNGLFVAVSSNGTNRVMTSPDGITWTSRTSAADNGWIGIIYGNGVFVAVANSSVMTSGKTEINALAHNNLYQGGLNVFGNVGISTTSPYSQLTVWGSATGNIFEAVTSASSTALVIDSSGNVGIGNTSPTYNLDVTGLSRFTGLVDASHFVATSTTATSTFAGGLVVDTLGLVYDFSTNKVGIGTANPEELLHISAPIGNNEAKLIIQSGNEDVDSHLVLSTSFDTLLNTRKTAIVADAIQSWSRADLHFVLDGGADGNGALGAVHKQRTRINH